MTTDIVESWPCFDCGAMVGVPQIQLDIREAFNRELAKRRQPPLPKRAWCDACKLADEQARTA